jgi:hypothetical protein
MTHGTVAGLLLTDIIQERPNGWEALYDPRRISLKSTTDFLKENLNVAGQYVEGYAGSAKLGMSKKLGQTKAPLSAGVSRRSQPIAIKVALCTSALRSALTSAV